MLLLVAGLALIGYLIDASGPEELGEQLARLGWPAVLLLFVALPPAIFVAEAAAWRLLFPRPPGVGFPRLALLYASGESLNEVLPGLYLGGEPYKVFMLRRWGVPSMEALASVIVSRTAMTVGLTAFILLGLAAGAGTATPEARGPLVIAGLVAALVTGGGIALAYVAQRRGVGRVLARAIGWTGAGRRWLEHHRGSIAVLDRALEGVYACRPGRFWVASLGYLGSWSLEALEVAIFAWALGLPLGPLEIYAIGALAMAVKAVGSFVPGSAGVQEGGIVLVGMAFGMPQPTALALGVVRRARQLLTAGAGFLPIAIWGLPERTAEGILEEQGP